MGGDITVLLVEDEPNLRNSLSFILEREGFRILRAATGEEGVELARAESPDVVLLDIDLPGMDGFEVAEALSVQRCRDGMQVVMVTGDDAEDDIVRALENCADDYVVKPVQPRVLLARVRAAVRRKRPDVPEIGRAATELFLEDLRIDPVAFEAARDGRPLVLTRTEFRLLLLFVRNPDRAFDRQEILKAIHGEDCFVTPRSVDFQVHGLRRKLGDLGERIQTVRGVGFRLQGSG